MDGVRQRRRPDARRPLDAAELTHGRDSTTSSTSRCAAHHGGAERVAGCHGLDFSRLKKLTGATDGNLGAHIETLAKAGYVAVEKAFVGKKPQTTVTATAAGRGAFARHVATLQEIIAGAARILGRHSGATRSIEPGISIGMHQSPHNLQIPDRRAWRAVRNDDVWAVFPLQAEADSCDRNHSAHPHLAAFMNILLLGSGGREHALAWKIAASPLVTKLWCAPGNAGIAREAECVALDITDHAAVIDFCRANKVDFVVVGPDAPIAAGIVDDLNAAGFKAFGPTKAAGQLESSKSFTKALCRANNIPTAAYEHFTDAEKAKAYIRAQGAPIVVKADGLAAGKGVVVAMTEQEALDAVDMMFGGGFGEAGAEVVVEEFMEGEEASFFALCDGEHALPLATAQDHKRAFDGDQGPNTGGMGAYSPAPVLTEAICAQVMEQMIYSDAARARRHGLALQGRALCRNHGDEGWSQSSSNTTPASAIRNARC